ncbi:hypothetical protein DFR49_0787 [Hephaestia caeni]|uniref:Uncharacterized protein n=1 Tax=Hephaestia caeni TaxID=645617 RepID=A0A397PJC6_9SPHN|nr:hypothetical protein [Hephaestia caeni]RIA46254.1 hypothetical protein DFR49_0787 [Hephaestia caeni]
MKLPFDFATKFILRLVLPGTMLSAILWPLLVEVRGALGLAVADSAMLPVSILLLGWLVLLCDMPIYMLAEGRRYWPGRLRKLGLELEQKQLARLTAKRSALASGSPERLELSLKLREFPLNAAGSFEAVYPTRLGNLITASETYPDRKYGIDGVFGWYRLWVAVDKDLRGELDDRQAIVDSALYGAVLAALAVPACLIYAILRAWLPDWAPTVLPGAGPLLTLAGFALIGSIVLYRATLHAQAQYGELFCALFDQYRAKLDCSALIGELADTMADPELRREPPRRQARAIVRFLKWHKYRKVGEIANNDVADW